MDDTPRHDADAPDLPPGIESARRQWNRAHPGWVASYLPNAPADWRWVADLTRQPTPAEVQRGLNPTLYAPTLDGLSEVVGAETEHQARHAGGQPHPPVTGQPWGGDAA